jgi:hypothetical protein
MITLPFELFLYKLHVFLTPSSLKTLPILANAIKKKKDVCISGGLSAQGQRAGANWKDGVHLIFR